MVLTVQKITFDILMAEPARQYKFVLIYCRNGALKIEIDGESYELCQTQLLTITPKQYYQFVEVQDCEGYILEFTYDFFCKDDKAIELIYHNGLYCHFGLNEIIDAHAYTVQVEQYFAAVLIELESKAFEYEANIHAYLKLLIIAVSRCKILQQQRPLYKPDALFLAFLNLVRDNFEKRMTIKEYASVLNITEQKLNEVSKKNTGETTLQLINDLIVLEAKRLFNYENLSVKQVALQLGFDDTHYFSRFFKKQTDTRAKDHLRTLVTEG